MSVLELTTERNCVRYIFCIVLLYVERLAEVTD